MATEHAAVSSSPIRVLSRRSPPRSAPTTSFPLPSSSSSNPHIPSIPSPSPPPSASPSTAASRDDGLVVVGFATSRPTADATHLIDKILDSKIFAAGDLHQHLPLPPHRRRFLRRHIAYHFDPDKAMLFLHLSPSPPSSSSDDTESDHLRGLLFIFSVCHIVLFLHDGLRFDTQILKTVRVLQSAKHALLPFIRSQIATPAAAAEPSASSTSPPGRRANRHSSSISLMSGNGSRPSALPGRCTPVVLFVFLDDFAPCNGANSLNAKDDTPNLKGSGSVVVLARPASKGEGSLKKKLQVSLDSQIRFLIKKTRALVGTEPSLRGIGQTNSAPLFSLDATRAVALVDWSANRRGESLDFVTGLMDGSFSLDFENHIVDSNSEEVQTIKDFINRQSDILRGRGGSQSNASSGSVSGVGMVAAAAAAAAASAAAGKQASVPELPSFDNWLSSSTLIINGLLSEEHEFPHETGINGSKIQNEKISQARSTAAEAAISCLESSVGLNMKFSVAWCKRALPSAKDVYLRDLPACYPTSVHYSQLEKALLAFRSMVKGPAVLEFAKKLEDECTAIWESGRQLCDAISLTGKPCMHQRHTLTACDSPGSPIDNLEMKHSSGYFFLHACACGRSRRLQEDPFDFEFANCSATCEDDLPTLVLPKECSTSPLPPTSWRLLRLGGARYYKPSKGILQIGFCSKENFLLKWTISLEQKNGAGTLSASSTVGGAEASPISDHKVATVMDEETKKLEIVKLTEDVKPGGPISSDDTKISFGRGLPSFTMRKPFAEVVAGTVLADSTFPVLKQSKQTKNTAAKGGKQMSTVNQTDDHVHGTDNRQGSLRAESIGAQVPLQRPGTNYQTNDNPVSQIGTNLVPVKMFENETVKGNSYAKQITVFVGFEHECPYGHRFLLSPEHLMELDSAYSTEVPDKKHVETGKVSHEEVLSSSVRTASAVVNTERSSKPSKSAAYGQLRDRLKLFSRSGTSKLQSVPGVPIPSDYVKEIGDDLSHVRLDDGSSAFSLLNRNLPIYMNCPHCKRSTKQNHQDIKFASNVSQLQRIFLVTPPFPTVLATCPVIQFEGNCMLQSTPILEQQLSFTLGCQVILPSESFLTLSLPFVYGAQKDDGSLQPLRHLKHQPELSAWLVKGTALQIVSMGNDIDEKLLEQLKN